MWRNSRDPNRAVSVFGRVMGTPEANRNLADFSLNAGVVLSRPGGEPAGRTRWRLAWATPMSASQVTAFDRDVAAADRRRVQRRCAAARRMSRLTYQYQVHPWWQVQPDLQYVFNPGGGIADPRRTRTAGRDEFVLGVRTKWFSSDPALRSSRPPTAQSCSAAPALKAPGPSGELLGGTPPRRQPVGFLETVHRHATLTSHGDRQRRLNPYAVVVSPVTAGKIAQDDVLVDNFNNIANLQGTGTTIVGYRPSTRDTYLFARLPQSIAQCPGGVGLSTAMVVLRSGWVVVGSTPSRDGTTGTKGNGCLIVLDPRAIWSPRGPGRRSTTRGATWRCRTAAIAASLFISMAGFGLPSPSVIDRDDRHAGGRAQGDRAAAWTLPCRRASRRWWSSQTVVGERLRPRADRDNFLLGPTGLVAGGGRHAVCDRRAGQC